MGRTARIVGGASIVLAPLAAGVADQARMAAEPPASVGVVDTDFGVEAAVATLDSVAENQGLFLLGGSLSYAAALLSIAALVAIWRLAVQGSPRWAWAGAVLAALGVAGQLVHLVAFYGMYLVAARQDDRASIARFLVDAEQTPFVLVLFAPFFLALLCVLPQAVGLRRAGVIPRWALLCLAAGTVFFLFVGSTPWTSAGWTVLLVAGFAPAAAALLLGTGPAATRTAAAVPAYS